MISDNLAIKKAGKIPHWLPYLYETVDGGMYVTGCLTDTITRGKNKGKIRWLTKQKRIKVFISSKELHAAAKRRAKALPACAKCGEIVDDLEAGCIQCPGTLKVTV